MFISICCRDLELDPMTLMYNLSAVSEVVPAPAGCMPEMNFLGKSFRECCHLMNGWRVGGG